MQPKTKIVNLLKTSFFAHQFSLVFVYLMCNPRQLFFHCGPETPQGWTPLARTYIYPSVPPQPMNLTWYQTVCVFISCHVRVWAVRLGICCSTQQELIFFVVLIFLSSFQVYIAFREREGERGRRERERERERERLIEAVMLYTPRLGLNLQPGYVPQPGIKSMTL